MQIEENLTLSSEVRISVPWGHIAGRWYGDQVERPILALHGWLDNCGTFAKLAPLIAPYRSVLCIDLPGHGHSSHLPTGIPYHNMEHVRAILRIMQAYNWNKVSLMGHSMGGSVAFLFATIFPDRTDMIISLDIIKNIHYPPEAMSDYFRYIIEKTLISNDRTVLDYPSKSPSYTFKECEKLLYEGSEQSVDLDNCKFILERNTKKSESYPDKYYFSRDNRMKYMMDMNPDMGLALQMAKRICKRTIPYLVIKGGESTNISSKPTELDDYLISNNKKFECHIYPLGTHHLHLNTPKPVAQLIIEFMQKHNTEQPKHPQSKM